MISQNKFHEFILIFFTENIYTFTKDLYVVKCGGFGWLVGWFVGFYGLIQKRSLMLRTMQNAAQTQPEKVVKFVLMT